MMRWISAGGAMLALAAAALGIALMSGDEIVNRAAALLAAVATAVSIISIAIAILANLRAERLSADMRRLLVSVETALREQKTTALPAERATEPALNMAASRRVVLPPTLDATDQEPDHDEQPGRRRKLDNVVPLPGVALPVSVSRSRQPETGRALDAQILERLSNEGAEISLQPIVSATKGDTIGFEVYRSVQRDTGDLLHVRRISHPPKGFEIASFDRQMVVSALHASRRRLGSATGSLPLFVAVSEAFLLSKADVGQVCAMLEQYPALSRSVILSVPLNVASVDSAGLAALTGCGLSICADADDLYAGEPLRNPAVRYVRVPAQRLIDYRRARKGRQPSLLEEASRANVTVITVDVGNDEDAVALLDLGVDLMVGVRFSGPRQLKSV